MLNFKFICPSSPTKFIFPSFLKSFRLFLRQMMLNYPSDPDRNLPERYFSIFLSAFFLFPYINSLFISRHIFFLTQTCFIYLPLFFLFTFLHFTLNKNLTPFFLSVISFPLSLYLSIYLSVAISICKTFIFLFCFS